MRGASSRSSRASRSAQTPRDKATDLAAATPAKAAEPVKTPAATPTNDTDVIPTIDVLEGLRTRKLTPPPKGPATAA